jgi:hypothetical protein
MAVQGACSQRNWSKTFFRIAARFGQDAQTTGNPQVNDGAYLCKPFIIWRSNSSFDIARASSPPSPWGVPAPCCFERREAVRTRSRDGYGTAPRSELLALLHFVQGVLPSVNFERMMRILQLL